jgi:hypothetical protein
MARRLSKSAASPLVLASMAAAPAAALVLTLALSCGLNAEPRHVRSRDGEPIGALGKVDSLPLYELRLEAPYRLEELRRDSPPVARDGVARDARAASEQLAPFACTCFAAGQPGGGRVFGRNFDWDVHPALLLFTAPEDGYASVSMVDISYLGYSTSSDPFRDPDALVDAWRIPFDGMNEKGLAVGMMAISRADGISGEGRKRVGELGIMRIILDRATTVEEALALMGEYDIELEDPPIHYFLADRAGDAAVVEFLDGQRQVYRNEERWMVSTNFLFSDVPPERRAAACGRFALATARLEASGGELGEDGALALLKDVSQGSTRWSAVYDLEGGGVTIALGRNYRSPLRRSLDGGR